MIPVLAALGVVGALAVAGSGTPPASLGEAAAAAPARPNIVVIQTDDQTLESMRVMDNVNNLIGDQGARFNKHFLNFSLCCPSRATFLTGQYMHNHGVRSNQPPDGGFYRFHSLHGDNNLAVWLRQSGYYTAMIGKYLNHYSNQPLVPPGWSEWRVAAPHEFRVYNYPLNENGTIVEYGQDPADFKQDVLTQQGRGRGREARAGGAAVLRLAQLHVATRRRPAEPEPAGQLRSSRQAGAAPRPQVRFRATAEAPELQRGRCLRQARRDPQPPRLSATQIADIQRKYRCELESLLSVDQGVKRVVDALRASGELDDTMIAYTTDNGYFHGEHRIPADKMHVYEESIRVPLQIRGPGIPAGVNIGRLSINADLAPTIVDAANADPGRVMDGRSLIPVANNPGIEAGRLLLIEEPTFAAIRTERYVYAEYSGGAKELYDLDNDPFELRSRHKAPAYADVRTRLANRLHQLESCRGSGCRLHTGP